MYTYLSVVSSRKVCNNLNKKIEFMTELEIKNKQKYLDEYYPFGDTPKLTDKKRCIHCESDFVVGDYKVFRIPWKNF